MLLRGHFPILIAHGEIRAQSVAGVRLRELQRQLEAEGWKTIAVDNGADAGILATAHRGLAAVLFSAEALQSDPDTAKRIVALMDAVHQRSPGLPVIALGETAALEGSSPKAVAALRNLHGILYLYEDTVPFLARQVMRAAEDYLAQLLPPFFKALVQHAERSAYSWHTPGHAGGVGFLKSPAGYALHQFFGENTLRSDLSISVPELGSLLDHTTILYGSGISNSNAHSGDNLPLMLVGGGAGTLKGGRHLVFNDQTTMANLLVTLMDKLQVPVDHIGGSTGALPIDTLSGV